MGRFETEFLATDDNIAALAELSGAWTDRVHDRRPPKMVVLDMDSSVSPTYGDQEGTAYNGHFGCGCYHPLFLFNHMGDEADSGAIAGGQHVAIVDRVALVERHLGAVGVGRLVAAFDGVDAADGSAAPAAGPACAY
jgi:hypothetical protein